MKKRVKHENAVRPARRTRVRGIRSSFRWHGLGKLIFLRCFLYSSRAPQTPAQAPATHHGVRTHRRTCPTSAARIRVRHSASRVPSGGWAGEGTPQHASAPCRLKLELELNSFQSPPSSSRSLRAIAGAPASRSGSIACWRNLNRP